MHNATIRCFDFADINFRKVKYQSYPLDAEKYQPVEKVRVR